MKFEFTGRHLDVTPALRSHVVEHFDKLNHIFDGKPAKAHVIIEVERGKHRSEIIVKWRNDILTANTSVSDMYQSLTQTIGKIEKQALKLKKKVIDKSHKAKKVSTITPPEVEVMPAPAAPKIVSARKYAVKPLTDEEAAMQLEAEVNQFLVFRNAENQRISVIYKRKDGNYGLIEP
ncbi:MAG: ribosome-associated translation inhibitor RaiA [Acidobacteriota bacterium]|nr:ribosome-associated translation inhibitor RaiA [Acidobacteriota bacterium]